ncbi:aminotransferase class IV [Bifidobacterium margollesii]|uniref:Aminotransferase class IV n=1 Tax=Bifidobacterium margollesii TaxID=2020964 RepID=A0A2N5JC35_9BIFI|nr:aminotransferase class IV [Bifidobacterium margollesii]PLS31782.1 aminotransferase class IV [Bifidobacterium margollesii]
MIYLDEGYQFGLGVFETIAVHEGRPLLFDRHMRRLAQGLRFLGIDGRSIARVSGVGRIDAGGAVATGGAGVDASEAAAAVERLVRSNGRDYEPMAALVGHAVAGPEVLKIMVSARNLAVTTRANPYERRDPSAPMRLMWSEVLRNETSPLVHHKTLNQGDGILETRLTKSRGFDGAVMLNSREEIAETTNANIFFVKRGGEHSSDGLPDIELITPAADCGLLPGVLRDWVMRDGAPALGVPVKESHITASDLNAFDECFITNSLMGVWPVASIGERVFPAVVFARRLRARYREEFGLGRA